jgi:hypothetical protein
MLNVHPLLQGMQVCRGCPNIVLRLLENLRQGPVQDDALASCAGYGKNVPPPGDGLLCRLTAVILTYKPGVNICAAGLGV